MTAPKYDPALMQDAGFLREYVAYHFGQYLTFGGSLPYWNARRCDRLVARLAALTEQTVEQVVADLQADAAQIFA